MPRFSARSRPTSSIEPLMSSTVTSALRCEASTMRKAMSPVPPATSSERQRPLFGGLSAVTIASFHTRCMPPDIRSFITS
jgi:hypothetical protein